MMPPRAPALFFKKPYAKAAWGFFFFFILNFLLLGRSVEEFYLRADSDDLMRLARVKDWMQGASWYEMTAPRLGWGGEATMLPWSRLVDLPVAALALLFKPFMDLTSALQLAGLLVPPLLLGCALMPVAALMMRGFIPARKSWLGALLLFGAGLPLLAQFVPARVDHHGAQLILMGTGFAMLVRLLLVPHGAGAAWVAALSFGASFWIGGEAIPSFVLFAFALGGAAVLKGRAHLVAARRFGLLMIVVMLVLWPLARPVWLGDDFSLTWFSGAYVLFACLTGLALAALGAGGGVFGQRGRMVFASFLAFTAGGVFFLLVPEAARGPFANLPESSAQMILPHVGEAQPLVATLAHLANSQTGSLPVLLAALSLLIGPVAALAAGLMTLWRRVGRRRVVVLASLLYLTVFLGGALFWQTRLFSFAQLAALPLLAVVVESVLRSRQQVEANRSTFWKKTLLLLVLVFGGSALAPALLLQKPVYPDSLLFYARTKPVTCDMRGAWKRLAEGELAVRPLRIANMMNEGAGLVLHTPHFAMSAPYGIRTNKAGVDFFSAREEEKARRIAQDEAIDLVVLCRRVPDFYVGGKDGLFIVKALTLAERLVQKKQPAWLRPLEDFEDKDVLIYQTAFKGAK